MADIDGDALAKLDFLKVGFVGAVGAFRPGARIGIVVEHSWHAPLGQLAEVFNAGYFCRGGQESSPGIRLDRGLPRSEEHTSELQSLMRISYAVFCLKKKKTKKSNLITNISQTTHNA